MANISVSVSLKDTAALERGLLEALAKHLSGAIKRSLAPIKSRLGEVIGQAIQACPEYASLLNGRLRGELGVVNAEPVLKAIIRNIAGGVQVTSLGAQRVGSKIEGGLRIEILKGDYSEVLGVRGGSFKSEGGYDIDWLEWLTLKGDSIVVADHRFVTGFPERSRTGMGLMQMPGSWRVPAEFSGTSEDNWLVRALIAVEPEIGKILGEELQKAV
jgi:hypothetical protein